jgi:hypothetical protein
VVDNLKVVSSAPAVEQPPDDYDLSAFKPKAVLNKLETAPGALLVHKVGDVKDFFMVHPDEENWWSCELSFINVPVKGSKGIVHLILDDLVNRHINRLRGKVQYRRLALATKPERGHLFLLSVPTRNLDNIYNQHAIDAIERAKTQYMMVTPYEDKDGYIVETTEDPAYFPAPDWWPTTQTINKLIKTTYADRMIVSEDDPNLKRLIGGSQT